eukprot:CAMPEP_0170522126 /NCGR_PEP_ID=MMETSP0209-20121228/7573_1 /TAXON_ID=665100 ORGANISM="Litonotus pictus, Strain P1" /NCGR_SAMPLE_ID=MMETSP0209 /ASSEMBLY_ACC=CAM_ASM_000301 /LENGTH=754 /DNA_ID=CAMNT_0010809469 /DNA_START=66 /DNA_END=2333 /DNA_ORIENTATION=+
MAQYDTAEEDDANMDIFADGILEEYEERFVSPEIDRTELDLFRQNKEMIAQYSSQIEPRRKNPIKVIIVKSRKDFGAPYNFYDKDTGAEGNFEVKPAPKAHECPTMPRPILEIGFQTKFSTSKYIRNTKTFQVPKIRKANAFTQVFEEQNDVKGLFNSRAGEYLNSKKDTTTGKTSMQRIEQFIDLVRPKVEEALQSNETIDIFQSDFQLDRFGDLDALDSKTKKNNSENDIRTFRDNTLAGQKSKREKSVNQARLVLPHLEYIAHTLLRNLSFEERTKVIGIPYTGQILFWNFKDPEINSPVFVLDLPMEVTCFEFNPLNVNILVCGLFSGQLIIYEFERLLFLLQNGFDSEYSEQIAKANKQDLYTFYITGISESHKTHINSMKWLPKGYNYHKYQLNYNESLNEINLLATVAEDGQVCIWDILHLDKTIKNEVSNYIKPVLRLEVNKLDSLLKISGSCLELKLKSAEPYIYVGTDDGQIYTLDWREKVSPENLTGNIKKIFNPCYFRPVLSMEFSPFYEDIFVTLHDFYFCIWNTQYTNKPILISPNLKSTFYVSGRFSRSRPGVLFLARNNGQIDIWDFLDESHKPSVKESFLKESIVFIDIIVYTPVIEDENFNKRKLVEEYLCIGDQAGQLTLMIIPKLFIDTVPEEKEMIRKFFDNELARQRYMDTRFKALEEEYSKPPDEIEMLVNPPEKEKGKEEVKEETEWRYLEDAFVLERQRIIEEYGFDLENGENAEEQEDEMIDGINGIQ